MFTELAFICMPFFRKKIHHVVLPMVAIVFIIKACGSLPVDQIVRQRYRDDIKKSINILYSSKAEFHALYDHTKYI